MHLSIRLLLYVNKEKEMGKIKGEKERKERQICKFQIPESTNILLINSLMNMEGIKRERKSLRSLLAKVGDPFPLTFYVSLFHGNY